MSNVAKQIYRQIDDLFPDLQHIEPFTKVDLSSKGLPDIQVVVFESTPDRINFILSRYCQKENGRLVANPSIEISANPQTKTANVVTYKDDHYFHAATPKAIEIGVLAQSQANGFLYDFLRDIKTRQKSMGQERVEGITI